MVRKFRDEPVTRESVERLLWNAVRGPSAGFSQGQAFIVLTGAELAGFWTAAGTAHLPDTEHVQVVIIPLASKDAYLDRYARPDKGWTDRDEARWPVPFWYIDTGMATLLILQTAVDEGLGALYFGLRPERLDAVRALLGIPDDHEPIGGVAIGHPADEPRPGHATARRPLESMVHYGRW